LIEAKGGMRTLFCAAVAALCIFASGAVGLCETQRITVAVYPLANATGDTNLNFWWYALTDCLVAHLSVPKALHVLPDSSIKFAVREKKIYAGQRVQRPELRDLAKSIEAERIVWGSFAVKQGNWTITCEMMRTATGETSKTSTVTSSNYSDATAIITRKLAAELHVKLTPDEEARLDRRFTDSSRAAELFNNAYADAHLLKPMAGVEAMLREALKEDPKFPNAIKALAGALINQARFAEAEQYLDELKKNLAGQQPGLLHVGSHFGDDQRPGEG
jgi:hypothetical protein